MLFFISIILALTLEVVIGRFGLRPGVSAFFERLSRNVPRSAVAPTLIALVIAFGIEITIVTHAAQIVVAHVPWTKQLPLPITQVSQPFFRVSANFGYEFFAISIVETLLLGILQISAARGWRRPDTIATTVAALAIAVLAVSSPALTSGDLYAYVADALLGAGAAYTPPATMLDAEFAVIHRIWQFPLLPAAYGPLWLWFNALVVGTVNGLYAKLIVLRLVNVVALALILGALRLLKVERRLIAAVAVNPAIAFYYLCNGHNDLMMIALILIAMTFAARLPLAAGIVVGIAASLKLSLIVSAAAVAIVIRTLTQRVLYLAVLLGSVALITFGLGGKPYLHALAVVSANYAFTNDSTGLRLVHFCVAFITVTAVAFALGCKRTFKSATFGFVALAEAFFPWYAIWALPYAAVRRDVLATLLVGLPVVTAMLDGEIRADLSARFVAGGLLLAIASVVVGRPRNDRALLRVGEKHLEIVTRQ